MTLLNTLEANATVSPIFTVFTPTYNRANTLPRTFASLEAQTFRHFEWVIVDDGSEDGTQELVEKWIRTASFPIRYSWQPNLGKHVAFNTGAKAAGGLFFLNIDSDDELTPDALQTIMDVWTAIPDTVRNKYCGVCLLCADQGGRIVGEQFPTSPLDCTRFDARHRFGVIGEKFLCHLTQIRRDYPFPELPGLKFVPESYVTIAIDAHYLTRHVNMVGRIYWSDWGASEQITHSAHRNIERYAPGQAMLCARILNDELRSFWAAPVYFLFSAARFTRFSLHAGDGLRVQANSLHGAMARVLWVLMIPAGLFLLMRDGFTSRSTSRDAR